MLLLPPHLRRSLLDPTTAELLQMARDRGIVPMQAAPASMGPRWTEVQMIGRHEASIADSAQDTAVAALDSALAAAARCRCSVLALATHRVRGVLWSRARDEAGALLTQLAQRALSEPVRRAHGSEESVWSVCSQAQANKGGGAMAAHQLQSLSFGETEM